MNQKALKTLEFDKIIHRLTEHAASVGAKKKCMELVPVTSLWEIERAQTQTADALRRIWQKGSISFGGIRDIRGSIKRLEIGGILGMGELLPDYVPSGDCPGRCRNTVPTRERTKKQILLMNLLNFSTRFRPSAQRSAAVSLRMTRWPMMPALHSFLSAVPCVR